MDSKPSARDTEHIRASQLLREIETRMQQKAITLQEFVSLLGDRSFALTILVFSLPNSLPIPGIPGFSTITGIPILMIAMQMVLGKKSIWLPEKVAKKEIASDTVGKIITKSVPYVAKVEKFLHPRFNFFCSTVAERLIGLLIVLMAFILTLPIVGGNFLPGFSISLMALAILERDGLFAIFSMCFCVGSLVFMYRILEWLAISAWEWLSFTVF